MRSVREMAGVGCACSGACQLDGVCPLLGKVTDEPQVLSQIKREIGEFFGKKRKLENANFLRYTDQDFDQLMANIDYWYKSALGDRP